MQIHLDLVTATRDRLIAAGIDKVAIDRDQPTSDADYPITCVHILKDHATADDSENTGVPDFKHQMHLCVDSYSKAASGQNARASLYVLGELVRNALLCDPTWLDLIEGVRAIDTAYLTPTEGRHSLSGMRVELVIVHRTTWEPSTAGLPNFAQVSTNVDLDGDGEADLSAPTTVPTA